MNTSLRVSTGCWSQLKYALLIPAFFFLFIFIYTPFTFQQDFNLASRNWTFHLLMMTCIMVCVLAITRTVFYFLYKYIHFKWWHYVMWCFGEVLVISFFFALYTSLFHIHEDARMPYFTALPFCFKFTLLTLFFPYLVSILLRIIANKGADIENATKAPDSPLVKLYDEHKRLKLTIDASAILYVAAESNYICIHYLENDREKTYMLRNSMKSFEEAASRYGIIRCHRSYFVNPRHIKLLSRSKEGLIYTEFTVDGVDKVPVSKMYYDALASSL